jgi:hypothetical protein
VLTAPVRRRRWARCDRPCIHHWVGSPVFALLRKADTGVRLSEHIDGDGDTVFPHACKLGLEGIVAKCRARLVQ